MNLLLPHCVFRSRAARHKAPVKEGDPPPLAGQDTESRRGEAGSVKVIELAGGRSWVKVPVSCTSKGHEVERGGRGWGLSQVALPAESLHFTPRGQIRDSLTSISL